MKTLKFVLVLTFAVATFSCQKKEATIADELRTELIETSKKMYVIEREIPGAGDLTAEELKGISQVSCGVIDALGSDKIKWLHSYVTNDKVFCVYLAASESVVKEHASQGGFPANSIAEVGTIIDPLTAN